MADVNIDFARFTIRDSRNVEFHAQAKEVYEYLTVESVNRLLNTSANREIPVEFTTRFYGVWAKENPLSQGRAFWAKSPTKRSL